MKSGHIGSQLSAPSFLWLPIAYRGKHIPIFCYQEALQDLAHLLPSYPLPALHTLAGLHCT